MKLDDLLIYTYCLFKAYLWGPIGLTDADSFEYLKSRTESGKLTLYRRADFDQKALDFYCSGRIKEFSWNGVISTSLLESATGKFSGKDSTKKPALIVIEVDFTDLKSEDLNALYLAKLSRCPGEEEVALAPGSIFQLLEAEKIKPKDKEEVEIRLKLVTDAKVLAHRGKLMHGMLQTIMRNENELKIVCLKEKELSRAIKHCKGNRLIKDLEFCFCTFNEKAIKVFKEILPTIENLAYLTLNIVVIEEDCQLDGMLECFKNKRMKKLQILGTLNAKRHIEEMIESMKHFGSLEYLKLSFEKDCKMDVNLLQDFFRAGCQFLDPECILDLDIGTNYNLVAKRLNRNNFEKSGIIKAINKYLPTGWRISLEEVTGDEKRSFDFEDNEFISMNQEDLEKQGSLDSSHSFPGNEKLHAELKICHQTEKVLRIEEEERKGIVKSSKTTDKLKETIMKNVEIIESPTAVRKYCFEGIESKTLLEALEGRFLLGLERTENERETKNAQNQNEFSNQDWKGTGKLKLLTSLYLSFDQSNIRGEELSLLCSQGIQRLRFLKTLDLNFNRSRYLTDEVVRILSCEGIKHLRFLTSLRLNFSHCWEISNQGLREMFSEGIRHLKELTFLHLDLSSRSEISNPGFESVFFGGTNNLQKLTSLHLNFSYCKKVSNKGFERMFSEGIRNLKELTSLHLNFSHCREITDHEFKRMFSEGIQYLEELTSLHLNFEGCDGISDKGLESLSCGKIQHLKKLTFLHINLKGCAKITDNGFKSLCFGWIQGMQFLTSFNLISDTISEQVRFEVSSILKQKNNLFSLFESREIFDAFEDKENSESPFSSMNRNENAASVSFQGRPGFYFQKNFLQSETSILKLLATYSPFGSQDRGLEDGNYLPEQTLIKYHVTLQFSGYYQIDNDIGNQENVVVDWKDVATLSFVDNYDWFLPIENLNKFYKDTFQCFKSITTLNFSSNQASFPIDEGLQSLIPEGVQNLKLLESVNLIFPRTIIDRKVRENIFKASSPLAFTLFTQREIDIKKAPLHVSKQNLQASETKYQISKTENHKDQIPFQRAEKRDLFSFEDLLDMNSGQSPNKIDLNEKNIDSLHKNWEAEYNLALGHENTFLSGFNSLVKLNLNFSARPDMTNEELKIVSAKISGLELLKVLKLCFSQCKQITDEGLLNLSSQALRSLVQLNELNLDFGFCDKITNKGVDRLSCEGIKHLELLTKLDLNFEWCQLITDIGLESLSDKVTESFKLLTDLHLNLNNCAITDSGLERLSDGIQNLKSLVTLSLNFDRCYKISNKGIASLSCRGIQYLKSLTSLHLSFDGDALSLLTNKGFQFLCLEGIQHLTSLVSLYLNFYIHEGIADEDLEILCCAGIQHLNELTTLELISGGENQTTDRGIKSLAFKGMSKLIPLENLRLPLMRTTTSSPSIYEAFIKILTYFGLNHV